MKKIYDCPQFEVVEFFVNATLCADEKGDDSITGGFTTSGTFDIGNS